MRRRNDAKVTVRISVPSTRTDPVVGSLNRGTISAAVDLPDPLAPTNATVSPGAIRSEKPCNDVTPPG